MRDQCWLYLKKTASRNNKHALKGPSCMAESPKFRHLHWQQKIGQGVEGGRLRSRGRGYTRGSKRSGSGQVVAAAEATGYGGAGATWFGLTPGLTLLAWPGADCAAGVSEALEAQSHLTAPGKHWAIVRGSTWTPCLAKMCRQG